jgi:hypothetical protein
MGLRCRTIRDGKPCEYLAEDETCLLIDKEDFKEKCPALEKVGHEDKDEWMNPDITNRELM